jgi:predicted DNA-binding transcriptional regulator YafY
VHDIDRRSLDTAGAPAAESVRDGQPATVSLARLLSLVLALDERRPTSAATLADRLGVSLRTVYRDIARLQSAGVPVVGAPGRGGGLLLASGFRLPPLSLTAAEAIALAIAIESLKALPALPYRSHLSSAVRKIAVASQLRRPELLADVGRWLRIEPPPADTFHPERPMSDPPDDRRTGAAVEDFVDALVAGRSVWLSYRSPYAKRATRPQIDPAGVVVDRGLWYLVGFPSSSLRRARFFRADRVQGIDPGPRLDVKRVPDWRSPQTRPWLRDAMAAWAEQAPVEIVVSSAQATLLARDWYFGSGTLAAAGDDRFTLRWGEGQFERVRELVAWLGPPARLVSPTAWAEPLAAALTAHGEAQRQR